MTPGQSLRGHFADLIAIELPREGAFNMNKELDEKYMRRALDLAVRGEGRVNPNPLVGAVIVRDGRIIGEGYHRKYGELHAERNALNDADRRAGTNHSARNADMYVTLEPCCHYGKTPPCTDAIIQAGIRRVVVGTTDPNLKVAGKGIKQLKDHGIEVVNGMLQDECRRINGVFFHYINTETPYVMMKYAETMDGKIAAYTGESRWITADSARAKVQCDRNKYTGIMVGVGTVIKDNPRLNCRMDGGRDPIRIICDSNLRTPLDSYVVESADKQMTIIATCCNDKRIHRLYIEKNCVIIETEAKYYKHDGCSRVDLNHLMRVLGHKGIDGILLEGGGALNASALQAGIVNRVQAYIAPKIMGGDGINPVAAMRLKNPDEAFKLKNIEIFKIGDDVLIEADIDGR